MNAEEILERGANLAGDGLLNPLVILCDVARVYCGDEHFRKGKDGSLVPHDCGDAGPAFARAFAALADAAGGTLVGWYGLAGPRTRTEVVQLFEDALFNVQVGAS